MTLVVAGMFGIGGPEVMALLILALVLVFTVGLRWGNSRKRDSFSRFCPKCGRGLSQPADAPFCSYCGARLP
jgi:predicted amidophosphoribosyltransferase